MQKCHYLTTNQAYEVSLLFSEKKKEINVLESPYIVTDKYSKTVSFVQQPAEVFYQKRSSKKLCKIDRKTPAKGLQLY